MFQNGRVVRVGQKATVVLLSVNLQKRQMEFGPITLDGQPLGRGARSKSEQRSAPASRERVGKGRGSLRGERPAPARPSTGNGARGGDRSKGVTAPGPGAAPGFDARAVLDRLWRERGAPSGEESERPKGKGKHRQR
jgi:hypothetical protein